MQDDKIDLFNTKAPGLFKRLSDDFGYVLDDIKIFEINNKNWSTKHIYLNNSKDLKIVIEQAPYYTDYGFTLFIYNLKLNESNILYNLPHEKQDAEGNFITTCCNEIFSSQEILSFIKGEYWKNLNYIPVKK